jgi:hypothetical protein
MDEKPLYNYPNIRIPWVNEEGFKGLASWGTPNKANFVRTMTLTFDSFERGRSAAHAIWKNEDGAEFPMFLTHLAEVIETCSIQNGRVTDVWTVYKRGQNYGIGLAKLSKKKG